MSEETRNMLVLNYDSETTEFIKSVFSGSCVVTPADNLAEVSEKAGDGFDVILTGYAVSALSGEKITSYLSDVQKAFDETATALRENTHADETLLKEREREQAEILAFLKEHVRKTEKENALVSQEMRTVTEKSEVLLEEKLEAEKKAAAALKARNEADENATAALKAQGEAEAKTEEALKGRAEAIKETEAALTAGDLAEKNEKAALESRAAAEATMNEKIEAEARIAKLHEKDTERIEQLTGDLNRLREELNNAETLAEQTLAEKASVEEKLGKLQENWARYVEGA